MTDELQDAKSSEKNDDSGKSASSGLFKWFVLVTYIIFSSSLAMSEIIFAPVPKQAAAYYGIKGTYIDPKRYFNIIFNEDLMFISRH